MSDEWILVTGYFIQLNNAPIFMEIKETICGITSSTKTEYRSRQLSQVKYHMATKTIVFLKSQTGNSKIAQR